MHHFGYKTADRAALDSFFHDMLGVKRHTLDHFAPSFFLTSTSNIKLTSFIAHFTNSVIAFFFLDCTNKMGKDEDNAIELFNPEADKKPSVSDAFTSKVHVVDEDQEDPDIDMDLTEADINRAFVCICSVYYYTNMLMYLHCSWSVLN